MLHFEYDQRLPTGRLTRRRWLTLGVGGSLGWALGNRSSAAEQAAKRANGFGKAKSVILVFANGGQSQIDTWDPKPNAPLDVRGDFRPISTAVPGMHFCEHMPRIARVADRLAVVRSMSHEDLDHGSAAYLALTGNYHAQRSANPRPAPNDMPTYGAVLRRVRTSGRWEYDAVHLNGPAVLPILPGPGQNGGLLGRAFEPLLVGDVRDAAGAIPGLDIQAELPPVRLNDRLSLKQILDQCVGGLESELRVLDMNRLYTRAYEMLASPQTRTAFDLSGEPAAVRERYGLDRSGQALLLARRLVEAGVPFINVIWNHCNRGQDLNANDLDVCGWDTHNDIFDVLGRCLLPRFDQSFSALIEDLDERGLLDETLVVCLGEFGRAPRIALEKKFAGATPGRKHWASVYSIALAGAGVHRGATVGASDRMGAEPSTERYGPWDVAATMFHALGIDPRGHYPDSLDRPFPIALGRPMEALYE